MTPTTHLKRCKVWRYAIERLDPECEVIRLECVPLDKGIDVQRFVDKLAKKKKEQLEWWNTKRTMSRVLSINRFREKLRLKGHELAENMVFWVLVKGRKIERVIHGTDAARELSKELYGRLVPQPKEPEDTKTSKRKSS